MSAIQLEDFSARHDCDRITNTSEINVSIHQVCKQYPQFRITYHGKGAILIK